MDTRKLILGFILYIFLYNPLFAQCDIEFNQCFVNLGKSKTVFLFVDNIVSNEPQKQKIFLQEGYFYTFSGCTSPGIGNIIFGLQETQGALIKNNIISTSELRNHFEWLCKKSGFYHLIFWLHEGSGCAAVQVSIHPKQKFD